MTANKPKADISTPAIPDVTKGNVLAVLQAIKEIVETREGRRGAWYKTLSKYLLVEFLRGNADFTALNVTESGEIYFGDPSVEGTWRFKRSGNNLIFERFESGSWVSELIATPSGVSHNSIGGIQGGSSDEYYHLTADEYSELNAWLDNVTLSDDGGISTAAGATFGQLTLTPRSEAITVEKGAIFFDDDGSVYICTET